MAKKSIAAVKAIKSKKSTVTSSVKLVVKPTQTKSAASRKPASTSKQTPAPHIQKVAVDKSHRVDDKNFVVSGQVVYADKTPAAGLTVIAYDRDMSGDTLLGQAVTKEFGAFEIPYSEAQFRRSKNERGGADVIVCVYNDKQECLFKSKKKNNAPAQYHLSINLPAERFVVRGKVTDSNHKSFVNVAVHVFDRDLRTEQFIDKAVSDELGNYRIAFTGEKFRRADSSKPLRPELILRAIDQNGSLLVESPLVWTEVNEAVIDLIVPVPQLSEWEIITQAVMPLLIGQGQDGQPLPPAELTAEDLDFVARESGLDREQLRLWALAFSVALAIAKPRTSDVRTASVSSHVSGNLTANFDTAQSAFSIAPLYGWFRDGQPQEFSALIQIQVDELIASLTRAIKLNYIPELGLEQLKTIADSLHQMRIAQVIQPAPDGKPASLGDTFKTMPQSRLLQLDNPQGLGSKIATLLLNNTEKIDGQWQQIRNLVGDDALFNSVRRSVGLMQLTDGFVPFMETLQLKEVDETAAVLADLVNHDTRYWIGLARELGAPTNIEAESDDVRCLIYGRQLAQKIELMHPTPYVRHRVITGEIPVAENHQELLAKFLTANPGMRLKDGSVLVWMESDNVRSGGLSDEQIKSIAPSLLGIERISRLVSSLEYVGPLMKSGYESARDVLLRSSRDTFIDEMRPMIADETELGRIYDAAIGTVATTDALVLNYSPRFSGIDLPVIPSDSNAGNHLARSATTFRLLRHSANLQRLFGSQDYCECAHGASLYGPAAYLADLMQMLALRLVSNGKTALEVLLDRRPDLAEIDLTGDNTDITRPYIDLVLEILEAPKIQSIPSRATGIGSVNGFDADLSNGTVPDAMKNDPSGFAKFGIKLSEELSVHGPATGPWWIRDNSDGFKYRLVHSMIVGHYDLAIFPQSVASANKGYRPWSSVTSIVVNNYGTATYPWKLPFDAVRDEADTWLKYLGASRAEIMKAMASNRWNDIGSACEYLEIIPAVRTILASVPVAEYQDWGFTSPSGQVAYDPIAGIDRGPADWNVLLKNVSLLRSRARLTHRELLNVLETRFVRAGTVRFEITGDECNSADMWLEAMDAALARRIHIFVRLWRKLGWTASDLDRAIYAYGVGTVISGFAAFSETFLLFVANIVRLQASSELTIAQILDLFGTSLDTVSYWQHDGLQPQRMLSRYQQWFDNPALGKPRIPEFRVNAAGNALDLVALPDNGLPKVRISDHLSYVAAALGMSESELSALLPTGAFCVRPMQVGVVPVTGLSIEVNGSSLKEIEVVIGKIDAGATFSLLIQSSEDGVSFTDVPVTDMLGGSLNPLNINSSSPVLSHLTYTGAGKYLRCKITQISASNPSPWVAVRVLTASGIVSDELSLANLTVLCRYAILCRLFGVSIKELQMLMTLSGASTLSAINGPDKVLTLLDSRDALRTLDISITQADQLLRGPDESAELELNARAEALLTTVRAEALAIRDESTVTDDKRSVLLKSVLTGLGWDERLIAAVLGAEGLGSNLGDYEATLDVMPAGITLPTAITFEADTKRLVASRSTRPAVLQSAITMLLPQASGNLLTALQAILVEAGRRADFLTMAQKWLRAKKLPVHRASVGYAPALRPDSSAEWKGRLYYDKANKEICFVGWMMEADKAVLKSLEDPSQSAPAGTNSFAQAVDSLFNISENYSVSPESKLTVREPTTAGYLTIEALLLDAMGLEVRCGLILERLLPEWRRQKLHAKLSSSLSQSLGIPHETAEALLELTSSAVSTRPSFESLVTDAQLLASDPAIKPSRAAFEQAFDAAARLCVLGKLLPKFKIDAIQLPWLGGVWSGIDLTNLPLRKVPSVPTGAWVSLMELSNLIALRDSAAVGVLGLQHILAATTPTSTPVAYSLLASVLGYSEDTLRVFAGADGFNVGTPEWFRYPSQLFNLVKGLELANQMNMPASLFVRLKQAQLPSRPPIEAESEVQTLRQMALGKSTAGSWSDAERKVLDGIRQRRRDAAVDYLVHTLGVLDANDLYGYYLIDPQMNSCMMTSRIKQAISSVQLFIQRCLMNLESDAPPILINKQHWGWMNNYRVWEANRKVLLYPENWIEPELRDDKTPFFDDVVSSLQLGDATSDKAQAAVQTFLEKLTDLSRVDVVATCSDYDNVGRLLVTHVFARTLAEPHVYWYRQFIKQDSKDPTNSLGIWTAWQPIDLDIEGDHLIPFVWQGRLFLFWAIFSEEAKEPTDEELRTGGKPKKIWRMKLAWSEFKSGKWSSRKISPADLINFPLYVSWIDAKDFYFLASSNESGVTISLCLKEGTTFNPALPSAMSYHFSHQNNLISELYFFDGKSVRFASGFRTQMLSMSVSNVNLQPYVVWQSGNTTETPIDATPTTAVSNHVNMKIEVQWYRPVSLWNASGGVIKTQDFVRRSTQLLYSPEQGNAIFSAPNIASYSTSIIPINFKATPFIQSDWMHKFFVYPTWNLGFVAGNGQPGVVGYIPSLVLTEIPYLHFYALDWPQATRLRKTLSNSGIDELFMYDTQVEKQIDIVGYFLREYPPSSQVVAKYPDGDLEFSPHSATAQYNWELFFHVPFSIACNLSKNQRFEEAQKWFHFLFDPTDNTNDPSPDRYWRFRPFREAGQGMRIDELVRCLADPSDHSHEKSDFQTLIAMWKEQPFQPHLVARMRIRSYMYTVVMKYLDNLIAWGDQFFRRETLEALNEATQLYILAAQILGRRPEGIPRRTRPVVKSFAELSVSQPDDLSNALVEAENLVPSSSTGGSASYPGALQTLYFCVPNNPNLLEYYDRVEDRLFKLRNCMNIDGVVRQLPLFEPAIDPSLLVRAAAAGVDVGAVLADLNAPLPFYRFNVMAQKATELCSEVKALGAALLSTIEKGEAETLALMRSGHEIQVLQSVRLIKELQLHEAKANMDALGISLESAQKRFTHYIGLVSQLESLSIPTGPAGPTIQSLALAAIEPISKIATFVQSSTAMIDPIAAASMEMIKQLLARTAEALSATLPPESNSTDKVPMNAAEKRQLSELKSAHDLQQKAMDQRLVAQVLARIPDITLGIQGFSSSPVIQAQVGGTLFSAFANFGASILDSEASEHTYRAGLHSTLAGYQRRAADWLLQAELASKDIEQITKQIAASNLRIAIASQELRNHDLQTENAQAVDEFMHSKYSNRELYNWMSGQLSNLHFQSYQLAYDVAKRAERCFKHELGVESVFIKFGYWDNLKKGLLAGENLHSDLKRMEVAYLNQNSRELEITKHVTLRQLDPAALINLRVNGECEFEIPEVLFDLDFPGHYLRRIKSVSISVPCVVGPYASVSGTLTLLSSKMRDKNVASGGYDDEPNYRSSYLPMQSISTSSGQNDSGLFELNFRDERYLPFEGAGAISRWRFKLPEAFRAFDYETISDVVLHVRYTARDGGESLAIKAKNSIHSQMNTLRQLSATQTGLIQMLSLRQEFPTEWNQLRSGVDGKTIIALDKSRFPYLVSGESVKLLHFGAVAHVRAPASGQTSLGVFSMKLTKTDISSTPSSKVDFPMESNLGDWRINDQGGSINNGPVTVSADAPNAQWKIELVGSSSSSAPDAKHRTLLDDVVLLVGYRI